LSEQLVLSLIKTTRWLKDRNSPRWSHPTPMYCDPSGVSRRRI
jgi:hypothetical protein